MHILILGAGALGSLLGARLSQAGRVRISLLTTDRQHVLAIRQDGLTVEELDGSMRCYRLPAFDTPDALEEAPDLVLVSVKTHSIEGAVSSVVDRCHAATLFLTLQNGIGNWERIGRLVGEGSVLVGTTAQGATLLASGRIRHGGNGPTYLGEPDGSLSPRVLAVVEKFRQAGLAAESREGMVQLIWEKLHVNVGINAITALTGIRNGFIASMPVARELCRAAVEEAMRVARAKGFVMPEDMVERVLAIAQATAVNRSSMGQDVDHRKRTEIDAINGAIVALGEQQHLPTPVNQTLVRLVKVLEANYLESET